MLQLFHYALVFLTGFLTKLTDNWVDERFLQARNLRYLTGLGYGLLVGYLLSLDSALATLVVAIILGNLVFARIDEHAHQLAFAGIFVSLALFGFSAVNLPILFVLMAFAFADELLNEKTKSFVGRYRVSLKAAALAISIVTWNWVYFFALILFDLSYHFTDSLMEKFLRKFEAGYGNQLILDFYKAGNKNLNSIAYVKKLLEKIVQLAEMNAISKPVAVKYDGKTRKESGISGFVLIAESHVTIHTYPLRELAKVDVVSCKEFDAEKISKFLKGELKASEVEQQIFSRGKEYPKDIKRALKEVEKERFT